MHAHLHNVDTYLLLKLLLYCCFETIEKAELIPPHTFHGLCIFHLHQYPKA